MYYSYRTITDIMVLNLVPVILGCTLMLVAWEADGAKSILGLEPTQRLRYIVMWTATALCFVPAALILRTYDWTIFSTAVWLWWKEPPLGWIVAIGMNFGLLSPLLTLMTAVHAYRKPCFFAKSVGKRGWVLTWDVREGLEPLPVFSTSVDDTASGPFKHTYFTGDYVNN